MRLILIFSGYFSQMMAFSLLLHFKLNTLLIYVVNITPMSG